jgi:hypothetical protein
MSLREAISEAVTQAFLAIGDIKYNASYISLSEPIYDKETGTVSSFETLYPIEGVLYDFEINQIDNKIVIFGDQQFIFMASILPITPHINDRVRVDGNDWQIKNVFKDPVGVTWNLHLRSTNRLV